METAVSAPVANESIVTGSLARTPYHLTEDQIHFFDENGYLILRKWIHGELLAKLQQAGHAWIHQGHEVTPDSPDAGDYQFKDHPNGRVMYRVDFLHNKGQSAALELLGSPQVLAVAESMCGPNFVPTYESMVFKQEGDGAKIPWHQDAVHPRRWRIYNYDVYLDHSRIGAGALRVIPGSQGEKHDVCRLRDEYGWDPPQVLQIEMEPGDVLLHDVMVVHGSEQTEGNALRRTIYYEFRAAEEILEDGPWDETWIDRRMRLVPVALRRYQEAFPHEPQFHWRVDPKFRPIGRESDEEELKIAHLVHMKGSFCSAGNAGPPKK